MAYSKITLTKIAAHEADGYEIIYGNNPFLHLAMKWSGHECVRLALTNSRTHGKCISTVWAVRAMPTLPVGHVVVAPITSTAGRYLTVAATGLTADADSGIDGPRRVPCCLVVDRHAREYLIINTAPGRWVAAQHRLIRSIREIETADGELVTGELRRRVDSALRADI